MGLLLTTNERERFCCWLKNEIESGQLILQQMEKLNVGPLIQKEKTEIGAAIIILRKLQSIEEMQVG